MCYKRKIPYIIICEGQSEYAYLQELNRFLRNIDFSITFIPKIIGTGHCNDAISKYKQIKKDSPRSSHIYIWVDKDTYMRNNCNYGDNYQKKSSNIPNFLFSYYNFEDFLVMHLEEKDVLLWQNICQNHNHFTNPIHSEQIESLIKQNIFSGYKKGKIPFIITQKHIDNLLQHQENHDIKFKCDFAKLLSSYNS